MICHHDNRTTTEEIMHCVHTKLHNKLEARLLSQHVYQTSSMFLQSLHKPSILSIHCQLKLCKPNTVQLILHV